LGIDLMISLAGPEANARKRIEKLKASRSGIDGEWIEILQRASLVRPLRPYGTAHEMHDNLQRLGHRLRTP